MKRLFILLLVSPIILTAQDKAGIQFEKNLNWEQVKAKAKNENKFIFVDCYATWCQPCKEMEKVYASESLGNFINKEFVAVKYQLDTAATDNDQVKNRYSDASFINTSYKPLALPTYLFFSPDGELVERGLGAMGTVDFAVMAANATNPEKQFFTLVKQFNQGKIRFSDMPDLADRAKQMDEKILAKEISKRYVDEYMSKLPEDKLYTRKNFEFIQEHYSVLNSASPIFDPFFNHPAKVDSILKLPGFASSCVNYVIYKEEITPNMDAARQSGTIPDWKQMQKSIKTKFKGQFADEDLLGAKASWFRSKEDWKNYTKYLVLQTESLHPQQMKIEDGAIMTLNNNAWQIFLHSTEPKEMKTAIAWVDKCIGLEPRPSPGIMDTKAGLLYKLGKIKEAIDLETKADAALRDQDKNTKDGFRPVIEKMKNGEKIWLTNE